MKLRIQSALSGLFIVPLLALGLFAVVPAQSAYAVNCTGKVSGAADGAECAKSTQQRGNLGDTIKLITNVLLYIIGAVAVIMLVFGGFRYVISGGDSTQVANAKNTILYAVIGLVVALLAYAIVNFVISQFIVSPPAVATIG